MSVYRPSPGSYYWIDTTLPEPFRRVRVDSWADDEKEARDREGLLRQLYAMGQFETIRALLTKGEGGLLFPEVVAARREGRLNQDSLLADLRMRGRLWDALEKAFNEPPPSRNTQRERYLYAARKLRQVATDLGTEHLGPKARVRDLARVKWAEVLDAWPDSDADYMHVRRMLSRFLTLTLKSEHHPTRLALMAAIPAVTLASRESELSLDRFLAIIAHVRHDLRAGFWTMGVTGLRTGEYLACGAEHKRADLHVIEVPIARRRRTKAGQAKMKQVAVHPDLWSVIEEGIPSRLRYHTLREHWKEACRTAGYPGVRLHDIRHLCAHLGFKGGASVPDVQTIMRHANASQTLDYARLQQSREAAEKIASVVSIHIKRRGA